MIGGGVEDQVRSVLGEGFPDLYRVCQFQISMRQKDEVMIAEGLPQLAPQLPINAYEEGRHDPFR